MSDKNIPAFIDCYGDLSDLFTKEMKDFIPDLKIYSGITKNECDTIRRIGTHQNIMVYMAYLSAKVLHSCPNLKSISYLSTGTSTHGDLLTASKLGIRFEGVKSYGNRAVAEHAITLALASLKRLTEMDRAVRGEKWGLMRTEEISGKTFGIVGLGGIGQETAKIAKALGARTIAWNRSPKGKFQDVEIVPLEIVLAESDIISFHLALNEETKDFLNSSNLAKTKPGVILINTSRAKVLKESALLEGLKSGHIGHCAMDVFHQEPLPKHHPFKSMDSVTLTPHSAWVTSQAIDRLIWAGLKQLKKHVSETN